MYLSFLPVSLGIVVVLLVSEVQGKVPKKRCAKVEYIRNTPLKATDENIRTCSSDSICKSQFNVSYIRFPPYYFDGMDEVMDQPMRRILRQCCGKCVNYSDTHIFRNLSEVSEESLQLYDFVYPFFADSSTQILHGYHYLPYMDIPPIMLMSKKKTIDFKEFILRVFPITLICIFASIISGFLCWLLETRSNQEEFPRPFLIGWFEGFWWSFISMTTVGYGDKAPKTFWGRIYSVVWISLGIICYGLLTGIVYAEVMKINSPPPPGMEGKVIDSLLYRDYDAIVVAENGGKLYRSTHPTPEPADFIEDAITMMNNLRQEKVDGFVLDQYTYQYLHFHGWDKVINCSKYKVINDEEAKKSMQFFMTGTSVTRFNYKGAERLTYGILVRHQHYYDYFIDRVKEVRLRDRAHGLFGWNSFHHDRKVKVLEETVYDNDTVKEVNLYKDDANTLFASEGEPFRVSIISISCIILLILLLGWVFERRRTKKCFNYTCSQIPCCTVVGEVVQENKEMIPKP